MSGIENIFTKEQSEKYNIFNKFFEDENLEFKTDLTQNQIKAIVLIEFLDNYLDKEWNLKLELKTYLTEPLKRHFVSKNRLGRAEMVKVLQEKEEEGEERRRSKRLKALMGLTR